MKIEDHQDKAVFSVIFPLYKNYKKGNISKEDFLKAVEEVMESAHMVKDTPHGQRVVDKESQDICYVTTMRIGKNDFTILNGKPSEIGYLTSSMLINLPEDIFTAVIATLPVLIIQRGFSSVKEEEEEKVPDATAPGFDKTQ